MEKWLHFTHWQIDLEINLGEKWVLGARRKVSHVEDGRYAIWLSMLLEKKLGQGHIAKRKLKGAMIYTNPTLMGTILVHILA